MSDLTIHEDFSSSCFQMAPWVKKVFVEFLPKYLFLKRPEPEEDDGDDLDGMYAPVSPTKPDYLDSYIKSEGERAEMQHRGNRESRRAHQQSIQTQTAKSNSIFSLYSPIGSRVH